MQTKVLNSSNNYSQTTCQWDTHAWWSNIIAASRYVTGAANTQSLTLQRHHRFIGLFGRVFSGQPGPA